MSKFTGKSLDTHSELKPCNNRSVHLLYDARCPRNVCCTKGSTRWEWRSTAILSHETFIESREIFSGFAFRLNWSLGYQWSVGDEKVFSKKWSSPEYFALLHYWLSLDESLWLYTQGCSYLWWLVKWGITSLSRLWYSYSDVYAMCVFGCLNLSGRMPVL